MVSKSIKDMHMETIDLNEIKATPIEDVAERLGMKVGRHLALCPFHDDRHPSLHFDLRHNRWKCFACGAGGNVIDLVMRYLNMGFRESVEWIADDSTLPSPQSTTTDIKEKEHEDKPDVEYLSTLVAQPVITAEAKHFLYDERRIDPRVVRWCGLTSISSPKACWRWGKPFYDAPSLLIPYRDAEGRLLSVQGRYLGGKDAGVPRFRFPKGSRVGIYNQPIIKRLHTGDELWITEGCSDCWAMLSSGRKAVAIPSATSLTRADISLLRDGLPNGISLHMYPDNDAPGMRLYESLKRWLPALQCHSLPDGCKDFAQYFTHSG